MRLILISLAIFLTGCGTFSNSLPDVFKSVKMHELTPEQIQAVASSVSQTDAALSYFVLAGGILILAGIVMLAFSISRHAAVIMIAGGVACAFTGYVIEEYAHYALIALVASGLAYGGYLLGRQAGYSLGFENGKDHEGDR